MDSLPALNYVDIAALILIGIGGIQGFFRGFSGEIARLVGTVLAFMAGIALHQPVGEWIVANTRLEDQASHAVAFIATIALSVLIMVLLRLVVKRLIKVVFAEKFDKSVGIFAGVLRMGVVVCIIFLCMNMIPHEYLNRHFGEESAIGSVVVKYVPTVRDTLERANIQIPDGNEEEASERDEPIE